MKDSRLISQGIYSLGLQKRIVQPSLEGVGGPACSPSGKTRQTQAANQAILQRNLCAGNEIIAFEQMLMREGAAHQTIKSYRGVIRKLQQWWCKPLCDAKRQDLLSYMTYCIEHRHYSKATMNQVVNAIRAYYERLLERAKDELRLPRPRRERTLPNVCTAAEVQRMLRDVINIKHRTILSMIYGLGLRKAEVQKLLFSDIDFTRGMVHVRQAKGGKDRVLAIPRSLVKPISEYLLSYEPKHWLFEGEFGGQYSGTSMQRIFTKAKIQSGLPKHMTIHGLRHSYATHMVEAGTPLHVVKDLLGHSSIMTTQIYLHTSSNRFSGLHDPLASL